MAVTQREAHRAGLIDIVFRRKRYSFCEGWWFRGEEYEDELGVLAAIELRLDELYGREDDGLDDGTSYSLADGSVGGVGLTNSSQSP